MTIEPVNALVASHFSLSRRLSLYARQRAFELFMSQCVPNEMSTVLDIGATDDDYEEANLLEKSFPWPHNITCATLGSGHNISIRHPQTRHVRIEPGAPLPFGDREFDISYSNAVLEHVGGPAERMQFLAEAMRVSRMLFFVVPNRWFPVEHHTGVPFIHWSPNLFRYLLSGGKHDYWAKPEHLNFLSIASLRSEWAWPDRVPAFHRTGLPAGPLSSNIAIVVNSPR